MVRMFSLFLSNYIGVLMPMRLDNLSQKASVFPRATPIEVDTDLKIKIFIGF